MSPNEILEKCIIELHYKSNNIPFDLKTLHNNKYSFNEIRYAFIYYQTKGIDIPSIAWSMENMETPCSLFHAEEAMKNQKGDTLERNHKRLSSKSKAKHREVNLEYLFTVSRQNN